jgi:FtsH-binding integral membrane protein
MNEEVFRLGLVCWCLLMAFLFVIRFSMREWYSTAAGRSAFLLSVVVLVSMTLAVVRRFNGGVPDALWTVAFIFIAAALTYQLYVLESTQRRGEREERRRLEREDLRR